MRNAKVDVNQSEIVSGLRAVGASVESLHRVGRGVPDLLVGFRKRTFLMEVKSGEGTQTVPQQRFYAKWRGQKAVVRTLEEALDVLGVTVRDEG